MTLARLALVLLLVPGLCVAQQLIHRSTLAAAPFTETDAHHPTTPLPDLAPNAATPRFAPLGGTGFPLGDLAFDDVTGRIWETNGILIQATPNSRYPALAPAIPPTAAGTPPLTGLAVDGSAGVLYATDGVMLHTLAAAPPFAALAPAVALGFPAVAPPYTGLHYDSGPDLLIACDAGGYVYYFGTDGAPEVGNPIFAPPGPVPPATDVASSGVFVLPGIYVQFLGLGVVDYTSGLLQPAAFNGIPPGTEGGLAFHAHPAVHAGACACPGGGFGPMAATVSGPTILGSTTFGFALTGGPPSTLVLWGLDFSASPFPIGGGCTFWLPLPPWWLLFLPTDAAGAAWMPLPIPDLSFLVGVSVTVQWAAACPAAPSGFVVSDALRSVLYPG